MRLCTLSRYSWIRTLWNSGLLSSHTSIMCSKYGMASSLKPSIRKLSTLSLGRFSTSVRSSVKICSEKKAVKLQTDSVLQGCAGLHLQAVLRTHLQHPRRELKDDSQILSSCVWIIQTTTSNICLKRRFPPPQTVKQVRGAGASGPYPASGGTALFARGPSAESWPWWTDPGAPAELGTSQKHHSFLSDNCNLLRFDPIT